MNGPYSVFDPSVVELGTVFLHISLLGRRFAGFAGINWKRIKFIKAKKDDYSLV